MSREAQPGQFDLGHGEQAGHEVVVPEPHLEDIHVERRLTPPAEADLAHRRLAPVELLERNGHGLSVSADRLGYRRA